MKKILIAISDDFVRKVYSRVFKDERFEVLETKNGKEALDLVKREMPDIILADVYLLEIGGLEILEYLKKDISTQKIPVIIFAQSEKEGDRRKAIELEARDFIVGVLNSPPEVVSRIKAHLGEEKSYRFSVDKNVKEIKELAVDLKYGPNLVCANCGAPLQLFLIRDLSRGKNYFKVSFVCPKCYQNTTE